MNNFFENHLEEVKLITARSKKESRKSFSRLQKATEYILLTRNNKILENEVKVLEGINLHQFTDDGKVLTASSDRIYLPDVATRLYQGLDSILKSYKSHKVHTGFDSPKHSDENTNHIEYIDLADWDNEYLKLTISDIYDRLSAETKNNFDIEIGFEGLYTIWSIFNPESKENQFDEYILILTLKIFSKDSDTLIYNKTFKVSNGEVRNKRIDSEKIIKIIDDINTIFKLKKLESDSVKPELLVFCEDLTGQILIEICKKKELTHRETSGLISETYDKFGNKADIHNANSLLRQKKYYSKSHIIPCNINYKESDAIDSSILEDIEKLKSEHNGKSFIYVIDTTDRDGEFYEEEYIVRPSMSIYFDGKDSYRVDLDLVEVNNEIIDQINFAETLTQNLIKYPETELFVGVKHPKYSYIPSKNIVMI